MKIKKRYPSLRHLSAPVPGADWHRRILAKAVEVSHRPSPWFAPVFGWTYQKIWPAATLAGTAAALAVGVGLYFSTPETADVPYDDFWAYALEFRASEEDDGEESIYMSLAGYP